MGSEIDNKSSSFRRGEYSLVSFNISIAYITINAISIHKTKRKFYFNLLLLWIHIVSTIRTASICVDTSEEADASTIFAKTVMAFVIGASKCKLCDFVIVERLGSVKQNKINENNHWNRKMLYLSMKMYYYANFAILTNVGRIEHFLVEYNAGHSLWRKPTQLQLIHICTRNT